MSDLPSTSGVGLGLFSDRDFNNEDSKSESDGDSSMSDFVFESPRIDPVGSEGYVWKYYDQDFTPLEFEFDDRNSGVIAELTENCSSLECFELFITNDLVRKIVTETNRYANQISATNLTPSSRMRNWKDTNNDEMYVFFSLCILMTRQKKLQIAEYWSKDSLISTPVFGNYMSRDRYQALLKCLHFCSNNIQPPGERLFKIQMVLDEIKQNFKAAFHPYQKLCIDESLMLFKGRLAFKQYIPSKRHRFGIKLFVLCDCETSYIYDFIVYTGKTTNIGDFGDYGFAGNIILTLMNGLFHQGHTLFIDNWYSSPTIFKLLHQDLKTNVCGTVRSNRKFMPKGNKKLQRGEHESLSANGILYVRWRDKREVNMLTTFHNDEFINSGEKSIPKCVNEYNKNMGSVDKTDMLLSSVECVRKTVKWYKKLFFHILDLSILNSYFIYQTKTGKNISVADFQLNLCREMLQKYYSSEMKKKGGRPSSGDDPLRLKERHFPKKIPPTEKKMNPSRRCAICKPKRKETSYFCKKCDVALCVQPCFELYHTKKNILT